MTHWGAIKRLALVTLVLLLALNWVAHFEIERVVGERLLDLRVGGYDQTQAQGFASAFNSETRAVYRQVYLVLDTAFIGFFFGLLLTLARYLKPSKIWWSIIAFGVVFALADLGENYFVNRLIQGEPPSVDRFTFIITALAGENGQGAIAALLTRAKFISLIFIALAITVSWRDKVQKT